MDEAKLISIVEKGLFIKFGLLTALVFSLTFASPGARLVKTGAHKICQAIQMNCPTAT